MFSSRPRLLAAGIASAAVAGSFLASLATGSGSGGPLGPTPAAAAGALTPFDGCADVRDWYVGAALPLVNAWGLEGPIRSDVVPMRRDAVAGASTDAVGSSDTGTNVQEPGVDEADVAKTDGDLVVSLRGKHLLVTDVSGETPTEIGRVEVRTGWSGKLLLLGDRAVVTSSRSMYVPVMSDVARAGGPRRSTVTVVNLSDPSSPAVEQVRRIDGRILAAREHDGTVRIAVSSQPSLDFVHPTRTRTRAEARKRNRAIVRESAADDWIPTERVDGVGGRLVDCSDIAHPEDPSGVGTITILTMDPDEPVDAATTAVTADGSLVYASANRFYVATTDGGWTWLRRGGRRVDTSTDIHAFATEDETTEYVASGSVPGYVPSRWALSEYEGVLRVAAEQGRDWNPEETVVSTLAENGSSLDIVGSVGGIGEGEHIKAVRWFGNVGVVVTFRQTDPLYTLDLSDARRPSIIGELKIRGYSTYLHPIGQDLLLGVGQRANADGRERGLQLSVFDLSDLSDPSRVARLALGKRWGYSPVAHDSRAFTYLPDRRIALVPAFGGGEGDRIEVVRIDDTGGLHHVRTVPVRGWPEHVRTLPVHGGRVAVAAGGRVRRILDLG